MTSLLFIKLKLNLQPYFARQRVISASAKSHGWGHSLVGCRVILFNDDIIVGTVNLWETVEAMFWLDEFGYDGWHGLDLIPYREASAQVVAETVRNLVCLGQLLTDMFPAEIGQRLVEVSAFHPKSGGAPANVAVAAARLGA